MKRPAKHNPKRKIASADHSTEDNRTRWASLAKYGGNPQHKRRPGDFGLHPPVSPRPGKTLCDGDPDRPLSKADAENLLREGFRKGLISEQVHDGWPQNVWVISEDGEVYEAQLENSAQGIYHGYPLQSDDVFRTVVQEEWSKR